MLYTLYEKIIEYSKIPDILKIGCVTPVYKPGKPKNHVSSHKPISVTSNISKLFEKLLLNNLQSFIFNNNILPSNQYGFIPGLSVEHQLIDLLKCITEKLNTTGIMCIDIIFLDASNAFDTIPHDLLLTDIQSIGINDIFLKILIDFFTDRYQYVKYNDIKSFLCEVVSGVLQGGVLSPLLYNTFVRKFSQILQYSESFLFADDTNLVKAIYEVCSESTRTVLITQKVRIEHCIKLLIPLDTYLINKFHFI